MTFMLVEVLEFLSCLLMNLRMRFFATFESHFGVMRRISLLMIIMMIGPIKHLSDCFYFFFLEL